jgi:hypothetical protein
MTRSEEPPPPIKISSYGGSPRYVTLVNLTEEELERIQHAFGARCSLVGVDPDGRLEVHDKHLPLPTPESDPPMEGFWLAQQQPSLQFGEPVPTEDGPAAPVNFQFDQVEQYSSPSILIQHLCGYGRTLERYKIQAARLESYGFACLRSRRGPDGKFWEIWYLPGVRFAHGGLEEALGEHLACSHCGSRNIIPEWGFDLDALKDGDEIRCLSCIGYSYHAKVVKKAGDDKDKLARAVAFLRREQFGTLDVCVQRLAMVID